MKKFDVPLALLSFTLVAAACGPAVEVTDELGDPRELSRVYLPGVDARAVVEADLALRVNEWTVRSSDPAVFTTASDGEIRLCFFGCSQKVFHIQTEAPGIADLEILDPRGELVGVETLEVALPGAAELVAGADLLGEDREVLEAAAALDAPVRLVRDDARTDASAFALRLFRGDDRVRGVGRLEARALDAGVLDARVERTTRLAGNPWLRLEPLADGRARVALEVDGEAALEIEVVVVGPEAIARVDLEQRGAGLVAVTRDAEGRRLFGPAPEWFVDGLNIGAGHGVPLAQEPGRTREVEVCQGEICDALTLPGFTPTSPIDGDALPPVPVASCAQARASAPLFALLALGFALLRRRADLCSARERRRRR